MFENKNKKSTSNELVEVDETVIANYDFNDPKTIAFKTKKKKHQQDSISWIISGFILFFILVLSIGRITVVGQFFDDSIFNLIFGWFKYPVYLILLILDICIFSGIRFRFKPRFLMMIILTSLILCWIISLALLTNIYANKIVIDNHTINGLWSKTVIDDSFNIYWSSWLENSIYGSNYGKDKMDFLISSNGYFNLYLGGGIAGTLLASLSMYLSIPGAYIFFSFVAFLDLCWIFTGDPFYFFKPIAKRRGKSLRILSLKSRNNPNKQNKKHDDIKTDLDISEAKKNKDSFWKTLNVFDSKQLIDNEIKESDLTIKMPSYEKYNTMKAKESFSSFLSEEDILKTTKTNLQYEILDENKNNDLEFDNLFNDDLTISNFSSTAETKKIDIDEIKENMKDKKDNYIYPKKNNQNQDLSIDQTIKFKSRRENFESELENQTSINSSELIRPSREKNVFFNEDDKQSEFNSLNKKNTNKEKNDKLIDLELDAELKTFDEIQKRKTTYHSLLNEVPTVGHFGNVDPNIAREMFAKENEITPFEKSKTNNKDKQDNNSTVLIFKPYDKVDTIVSDLDETKSSTLDFLENDFFSELNTQQNLSDYEQKNNDSNNSYHSQNFSNNLNQYHLPNPLVLKEKKNDIDKQQINRQIAQQKADSIDEVFSQFNVKAKVINIIIGPSVTKFEIQPEPGTKVNSITALENDLKLALASQNIRLEAPIQGKNLVGIEIANKQAQIVSFKEIFDSIKPEQANSKLLVILGKSVLGEPLTVEINKMPHLLVAGSTGSGKSVMINTIIASILLRATPDEVKFLMIDPKRVELAIYSNLPHMLSPVISDMKQAAIALKQIVEEMDLRYDEFVKIGVRNIESYNKKQIDLSKKMPYYVVIIDELADLLMTSDRKNVEESIMRLTQMARAAGIHLIVATQRPSVDVITGTIKTNIPTRIAFAVTTGIDSRTILDSMGAEKLIGQGDMLFMPPGSSELIRGQGAYLSDDEIELIVDEIIQQNKKIN